MNKKDLTDLGIAEDVADKIIVLHGKDIESHKTKLTTAETEARGLKDQLADANKQIADFKAMKIEDIQKAAADWETKAKTAQADAEKQITALKFDHALDAALVGAKVRNVKAARALLNLDGLKLGDDGAIVGTDETKSLKAQLEAMRKDNDYLFEGDGTTPKIVAGGNGKTIIGDSVFEAMRRGAGLPEQGK